MAELCPFKVGAKVASWPILGWKLAILAIFFEIIWTSNMFCPSFTLILRGNPNLRSQLDPNWPLWSPETIKIAISQNDILATKIPTPPTFSIFLSEIFRINVNMDFAIKITLPKLFGESILTLILKISDKNIEKCRRSRDFGDWQFAKMAFWIWPFLWLFGNQSGQFGSNLLLIEVSPWY